jgi:aminoglycoside/choline kinase family phosphotransferase
MTHKDPNKEVLRALCRELFSVEPVNMEKIAAHASDRSYFRLTMPPSVTPAKAAAASVPNTLIGTVGIREKENQAFVHFAKHFHSLGLAVPRVYANERILTAYLQDDLGDISLHSMRFTAGNPQVVDAYRSTLALLVRLQFEGRKNFPTQYIHGRKTYDSTAMRWDLDGFRYSLLRPLGVFFDNDALEEAFLKLLTLLSSAETSYFMHRDFQARNVVVYQEKPYAIDFQGGRLGPLQYDLVSLLFQGSAKLSAEQRRVFFEDYVKLAEQHPDFNEDAFRRLYPAFALLFLLKVLGTYGLRGVGEGKLYFLESIPLALENIRGLRDESPSGLEYIFELCEQVEKLVSGWNEAPQSGKLEVEIRSFSYRSGFIRQNPMHGGGFVFDCRGLVNPHHEPELQPFTGRDQPIKDYFGTQGQVQDYYSHVLAIASQMVAQYKSRGYSRLGFAFGCTGGRHRSVYMAERLAQELAKDTSIAVALIHRELD